MFCHPNVLQKLSDDKLKPAKEESLKRWIQAKDSYGETYWFRGENGTDVPYEETYADKRWIQAKDRYGETYWFRGEQGTDVPYEETYNQPLNWNVSNVTNIAGFDEEKTDAAVTNAGEAAGTANAANEDTETADVFQAKIRANHRELNPEDAERLWPTL